MDAVRRTRPKGCNRIPLLRRVSLGEAAALSGSNLRNLLAETAAGAGVCVMRLADRH